MSKQTEKKEDKNSDANPIVEAFGHFSTYERYSVVNLLLSTLSREIEKSQRIADKYERKMEFVNTFMIFLGVSLDNCLSFFDATGNSGMIRMLKTLKSGDKELVLMTVLDMLNCDGQPSKVELDMFNQLFGILDVDVDKFEKTFIITQGLFNRIYK